MTSIDALPVLLGNLTGAELVLVVRNGQALLVPSAAVAQAPPDLGVDAGATPLERAKAQKRAALATVAARQRQHAIQDHASVLAGLAGALQSADLASGFDAGLAAITTRLADREAAVDSAGSLMEVDAVVW